MSIDPRNSFISYVSDVPPLTGSRHWSDLSGVEQDNFLLACFDGLPRRKEIENEFKLYDRIAASISHDLLGDKFFNFTPQTTEQREKLIAARAFDLKDTLLGERLLRAIARVDMLRTQKLGGEYYEGDPLLFFEYLDAQKTRGFEYLSPLCTQSVVELEKESEQEWNRMSITERDQAIKDLATEMEGRLEPEKKDKIVNPSKLARVAQALQCVAPIDLVQLSKIEPEKGIAEHFAVHIVQLAYDMIYPHTPDDELVVVRDCIRSLIAHLKWRYGYKWLPLGLGAYSSSPSEDRQGELIATSIVLTMLRYPNTLRECSTGIGSNTFTELLLGIEKACIIACHEGIENALKRLPVIKIE